MHRFNDLLRHVSCHITVDPGRAPEGVSEVNGDLAGYFKQHQITPSFELPDHKRLNNILNLLTECMGKMEHERGRVQQATGRDYDWHDPRLYAQITMTSIIPDALLTKDLVSTIESEKDLTKNKGCWPF